MLSQNLFFGMLCLYSRIQKSSKGCIKTFTYVGNKQTSISKVAADVCYGTLASAELINSKR